MSQAIDDTVYNVMWYPPTYPGVHFSGGHFYWEPCCLLWFGLVFGLGIGLEFRVRVWVIWVRVRV